MKKTILAFINILILSVFSGCTNVTEISSIELLEQPKTTYIVGEQMGAFSLRLIYNSGRDPMVISSTNSLVEVTNFSTEEAGTFTAYINYKSANYKGVPISIQYTVVDLQEIQGSGTQTDPYLIATADQWNLMDSKGDGKYFKLTNDIDFSGKTLTQFAPYGVLINGIQKTFSAHIDGAGYSLQNINLISQLNSQKYKEIFGYVRDFTLKNINIIFASNNVHGVTGIITAGAGNVVFDKVNTYGFIKAAPGKEFGNVGVFVAHPNRSKAEELGQNSNVNLTFNLCINYTDVLVGGTPTYSSGFIGFMNIGSSSRQINVTINSCINYGTIEGANANSAGFIASIQGSGNGTFTIINSVNRGLVVKSGDGANQFSNNESTLLNYENYDQGTIMTIANIKSGDGFSYTEGNTYYVQYSFNGDYITGGSGHIRIKDKIDNPETGTYPKVYINDALPSDDIQSYEKDSSYVNDVADKYTALGLPTMYINKKLVHSSWSETESFFVTVFEYNPVGKLIGVAKFNDPYDCTDYTSLTS